MNKKWYESKTIFAQVLGVVATLSAAFGLDLGLDPEAQAAIVAGIWAVVNVFLRFKTKDGIEG